MPIRGGDLSLRRGRLARAGLGGGHGDVRAYKEESPAEPGAAFGRPPIELEIHRCDVAAWQLFKRHHYLSGELPRGARCYLTTWDGVPVNFCATVPLVAKKNHRRFARIVTLPDFQGIGIGMRAVAAVAELHRAEGHRINVTSSHPALVRHCERSPLWRLVGIRKWDQPRRSALFPTLSRRRGGRWFRLSIGGRGQRSEVGGQGSEVGDRRSD